MAKIKDKERLLKAAREKQLAMYKGTPIRLSADFSTETLQTQRSGMIYSKLWKEKNLQPIILYLEMEIKTNKQKMGPNET